MNTRPQQQQDVARPGQGRRAGTVFAGYSGNGAEPFLGEQVEKCNESEPVYCWPVRGQQRNSGFERHRERQPGPVIRRRWAVCKGLRANARRPLPKSHHGAFREGFTPHRRRRQGPRVRQGPRRRRLARGYRRHKGPNSRFNFRPVSVLVWEAEHGPVPEGCVVRFRDGMATTVASEITIERLECITRQENMARNTLHRYPEEVVGVIQMRGALNRKINRLSKERGL